MEGNVERAICKVARRAGCNVGALTEELAASDRVNNGSDADCLEVSSKQLQLGAAGRLHRGAHVEDRLVTVTVVVDILVDRPVVVCVGPAAIGQDLCSLDQVKALHCLLFIEEEGRELKVRGHEANAALDLLEVAVSVNCGRDRASEFNVRGWATTAARCAVWKHAVWVCFSRSAVRADRL